MTKEMLDEAKKLQDSIDKLNEVKSKILEDEDGKLFDLMYDDIELVEDDDLIKEASVSDVADLLLNAIDHELERLNNKFDNLGNEEN